MNLTIEKLKQNQERVMRGAAYEAFIKRAHKGGTERNGWEDTWFTNLVEAESGVKYPFHKSYEIQLEKVRSFLDKAFDKFIARKLTDMEKNKLTSLKAQLENAGNTTALSLIIEEGLDTTIRFKEY